MAIARSRIADYYRVRSRDPLLCGSLKGLGPELADIEATLAQKIEAFCAHVSQFGRRLYKYEPELHPEDRAAFERAIRDYAASVGAPHGLALAEAFRRLTDP